MSDDWPHRAQVIAKLTEMQETAYQHFLTAENVMTKAMYGERSAAFKDALRVINPPPPRAGVKRVG